MDMKGHFTALVNLKFPLRGHERFSVAKTPVYLGLFTSLHVIMFT